MRRSLFALALSLHTLPMLACIDDGDPEAGLDHDEAELIGWITASPEGAVSLTRAGITPRTGVLVAPNLVLTHDSVARGWRANQFTASWGVGLSPPSSATQSRAGRHLNFHDSGRFALIQTDGDLVTRAFDVPVLSTRTPAQLAGTTVTCKAYNANGNLRRTTVSLGLVNGELRGSPPPGLVFEASDLGGPCIDGVELLGIISAVDTATNTATLLPANGLATWLGNMTFLAGVRDDAQSWGSNITGPATLSFAAPNGVRMCLDVPWGWVHSQAPVNQFPCHVGDDAKNEQVYLVPVDSTYHMIIFDHSGLCLNVPGGVTGAPINLQQYPCQTVGRNDRWGFALHASGSGIRFWPQSATNRNLGGQAGAAGNTPSIPVQQQTAGNPAPANQRWFFSWKAVR